MQGQNKNKIRTNEPNIWKNNNNDTEAQLKLYGSYKNCSL